MDKMGVWKPPRDSDSGGPREDQALAFFTHSPGYADATGASRDTWLRSDCLT